MTGVGIVDFSDRQSVMETFEAARLERVEWREGADGLFALSLAANHKSIEA